MVTRRTLLVTSGVVGTTIGLAGCSGGSQDPEEESESTNTTTDTGTNNEEQDAARVLPDFRLEDLSFTYGFTTGLTTTVTLRSEAEQGSGAKSVNVLMEAYDGETLIGEADEWNDIKPELTGEFELTIEAITEMADNSLDDVTEVRISGKKDGGEYGVLRTFSGETVRGRIEE
jgi:hypothetical protein